MIACIAMSANAQKVITGRVVQQSTSDDIAGAIVTLIEGDSTRTAQSQTDGGGRFTLTTKSMGKAMVVVTMTGFKPETVAIIGDEAKINIGYVYMSESSVELDEVTVFGSGIIEKVDKYIVLPGADQLERSAQSIDLFSQLDLPGLTADPVMRTIKVEDRNPVYQINGREQPLSRILNTNPKDILRIEYSNNPGIRYLDKGYSGVINVILRERQQGGSINTSANSALWTGYLDGHAQGSYNYKKSEFVLSYSANWRNYDKRRIDEHENYISRLGTIERAQDGENSPMYYQQHNLSLEYNYLPELNTMFSARLYGTFYDAENNDNGTIKETPWKGTPFDFKKYNNNNSRTTTPSLDLFFIKKLKHGQSIELNVNGTYSDNRYDRKLTYKYPAAADELFPTGADGNGYGIAGEAVYNKEFKKVATRFGVQYSHSYDKNEYIDGQISDQMRNNTYAYGEVRGRFNKVSYSLGSGLKVFTTESNSDTKTYYANNSTLTLLYPIAKGWSLNYAIMYQPNQPSLSILSPVEQVINDQIRSVGNPDVKPSNWLYNRALIRYNNNKGMTWAFWLQYGRTFDPFVTTYSFVEKGSNSYFLSRPRNENYLDDYGFQVNFGYQRLWNHLNVYVMANYHRFVSDGISYHHELNAFKADLTANLYFGKWTVTGRIDILPGKTLNGESISEQGRSSYLTLQYKFNNNFYVYGSCYYMLGKEGWVYKSENLSQVHPSYDKVMIRDNSNMVCLGLVYNLNFGKQLKKGKRTLNNSSYESGMQQN